MSDRLIFEPTSLEGPKLVHRKPIGDSRGFLERLYCSTELGAQGLDAPIQQINRTMTQSTGTLRGLHFQHPPAAEVKLISCLAGRVFDVAVDLRTGSASFGKWYGVELDGTKHVSFLIPEGFAHGFQTLTDDVEMLYLHTQYYAPSHEGGINSLDETLAIAWPLPITTMSERDRALPRISDGFSGVLI